MAAEEEEEQRQLELIENLKEQAIEQYEELKYENVRAKDEYDKVRKERDEAVRQLEEFNNISHKVIEEVDFIEKNLEIEKTCRESAEALASKLSKENKTLKRISMLCMAKLGPDAITEEINLDEATPDADGTACTSLHCQQRFKELQEQVLTAQRDTQAARSEHDALRSRLLDFIEEINTTKKENVMLRKEVSDQRKLLQKYNRVSVLAVEEYEALQTNLEMEKDLRETAESLAHEMFIKQKKLKRQSQLLLQSAAPGEQLLKALEETAKLTQALEADRMQHQRKVKELEEKLDQDKLLKEVDSLRRQLDLVEEDRKDLEAKCLSSESTIRDLKHSVETLQKRVQQAENPPPPPPPPPPPLPPPPPSAIQSFISLIRKKPGVAANASKKEGSAQSAEGNMVDIKQQAVDEMMARIRVGVRLRPVQNINRVKPKLGMEDPNPTLRAHYPSASLSGETSEETNPSSSAVQELRGIVNALTSSGGAWRPRGVGATATESELERILRLRKVTTEQDASNRTGALTTLESKSMPVLGSAAGSALSQKPKEAESTSNGSLLVKENRQDLKAASQSAETLSTTERQSNDTQKDARASAHGESLAAKSAKEPNSSNC